MKLDRYTLVLLRRPDDAPDYPEEDLQRIQQEHLAHLGALHQRGVIAVAGPFSDQPDPMMRGMAIYRTDVEETRNLAEQDPAVKAGRLEVIVMNWHVPVDGVRFS